MIKINCLTKKYHKKIVVDIKDLVLDECQVVGLVGKNGAGKSTLMKLIAGKIRPKTADILVLGERPYNSVKVSKEVGYYCSEMQFAGERIIDIVDSYEILYENFSREKCLKLLKVFELDINKKVSQLSQGMKAIFIVCIAMAGQHKIVLLDEPTAFMDKNARLLFDKLIRLEKQNIDKIIVISTHLAEELEDVIDKCIVICDGKVQCIGDKYDESTMRKIINLDQIDQMEEVYTK